jgi:hypothetical protein
MREFCRLDSNARVVRRRPDGVLEQTPPTSARDAVVTGHSSTPGRALRQRGTCASLARSRSDCLVTGDNEKKPNFGRKMPQFAALFLPSSHLKSGHVAVK